MPKVASKRTPLETSIPLACADESAAVAFLEAQRWGDSPCCPRCGDVDVRQMKAADGTRNSRFLWKCKGCRRQYTVRVGTIMEDSPIPLRHWCLAFYRAAASKKGVSALQIQRETGLTYKSALFLMHRIRWAMAPANAETEKVGGEGQTVEVDETYIGGRPRRRSYRADGSVRLGPGYDFSKRKTPVMGAVVRGGKIKLRVVPDLKGKTLGAHLNNLVEKESDLITDERRGYVKVGRQYASHETVCHAEGEYVRGDVSTNRIEGVWANFKRQINGTHHSVSKKHLHRYASEYEFKYNNRDLTDGERTVKLICAADQRRLTYRDQTRKDRDS